MSLITADDFIASIANALQFISYSHPTDYLHALAAAHASEPAPAARDAMAQILVNSRLCAAAQRPMCQDTGLVVAFLQVGMNVRWETPLSVQQLVDTAVHRAYTDAANPLRASLVTPPLGNRRNTGDNTPAVVHVELVPGDTITVRLAAKGGGSENKARFTVLNPSASIADWVVNTVATLGAGWCPPGMLGIGIGGSAEQAMLLAKEALLDDIDMAQLQTRGAADDIEALRLQLYARINALGIGAQGLGGVTTVLDVKIRTYPTHAASLPVALIPNCAATRHVTFTLDGSGAVQFDPPVLANYPAVTWQATAGARRVNLDTLQRADLATWQPGDKLLLTGRLFTARDAAHRRLIELLAQGQSLPPGVELTNRMIYYVGPVDPVGNEIVGPAGPTTATRMDIFTEPLLAHTGLIGMIGKAERGAAAIAAIKNYGAVYLIAVGGAAYLVAQAIKQARIVAFADLGMEAIREFVVEDMPVMVAVDQRGVSIHETGPVQWRRVDGV